MFLFSFSSMEPTENRPVCVILHQSRHPPMEALKRLRVPPVVPPAEHHWKLLTSLGGDTYYQVHASGDPCIPWFQVTSPLKGSVLTIPKRSNCKANEFVWYIVDNFCLLAACSIQLKHSEIPGLRAQTRDRTDWKAPRSTMDPCGVCGSRIMRPFLFHEIYGRKLPKRKHEYLDLMSG